MKTIKVVYSRYPESWVATSPDIQGYTALDDSYDELRKLVHEGIPFFVGEPVEIIETFAGQEAKTA